MKDIIILILLHAILASNLFLYPAFSQDIMENLVSDPIEVELNGDKVLHIQYSPDGKYLAVVHPTGLYLYDAQTYVEIYHLSDISSYHPKRIMFSPDSTKIAYTVLHGKTFHVWDVTTGAHMWMIKTHSFGINNFAFSPDSKTIASTGIDGYYISEDNYRKTLNSIQLWDVDTGILIRIVADELGYVTSVAFDPDGKTLVSSGSDGVVFWNLETDSVIHTIPPIPGPYALDGVVFSPDGEIIAGYALWKGIRLWNASTGDPLRSISLYTTDTDGLMNIEFSPDGQTIASVSGEGLRLWDVSTGNLLRELRGIRHVSFNPDGKTIASVSNKGNLLIWDATPEKYYWEPISDIYIRCRTLTGHTHAVVSIAFSPDGNTIVSGSWDKTIRLWETQTGNHLQTYTGHTDHITGIAISPDGRTIVSGSKDKSVRIWDTQSGIVLHTITEHTDRITGVAFSPDGRTIASSSWDETVRLWDIHTGSPLRTLTEHTRKVNSIAFSPDGRTIASGGLDKTIRIWDINTGTILCTLTGHTGFVNSVMFSPYGNMLASGGYNRSLHLWDVNKCSRILSIRGIWLAFNSVAFSPNGKKVAGASSNWNISIWDTKSGARLHIISWHNERVNSVAFSPDGQYIASGSHDGTIVIGNIGPPKLREDVNKDGVVNILDLTLIASNIGKNGYSNTDINNDGMTNILDLVIVATVYQK